MIGAIIIILIFVSLVVLLSPVTICVNSTRAKQKIDGFFSFGWLMFLLKYTFKDRKAEILVFGRRIVRLPDKEKSLKPEEVKKPRDIKKSKNRRHSGDIVHLVRPVLRLFKDIIYSFSLKYLDIDITFGCKDPAYTGIITGFLHCIFGCLRTEHTIMWNADFTKPVLEWNVKAEAAITPIRILPPVARFIAIFIHYKIPMN